MRPIALVLAALALAPTAALAQAELPDDIGERPVTYKPVTEVDFGEQKVEAGLIRPDGTIVLEPARPDFRSFIVLRANFNPELDQSAALVK